MRDCSLNYKKNISSEQRYLCTNIVLNVKTKNNYCTQHVLNLYFSCNSMNNLSSYCGLTDSRRRDSDTDLPVQDLQKCGKQKLQYRISRGVHFNMHWMTSKFFLKFFFIMKILRGYFFDITELWTITINAKKNLKNKEIALN